MKTILFIVFAVWNMIFISWSSWYFLTSRNVRESEAEILPFVILLHISIFILGCLRKSNIVIFIILEILITYLGIFYVFMNTFSGGWG